MRRTNAMRELCYRWRTWLAGRMNCNTCFLDSAQRIFTSVSQAQKLLLLRGSLQLVECHAPAVSIPRLRGPHLKQQRVNRPEARRGHVLFLRQFNILVSCRTPVTCIRANAGVSSFPDTGTLPRVQYFRIILESVHPCTI